MCLLLEICIVAVQVGLVLAGAGNEWAYYGEHGPDSWHLFFAHCGGVMQSPIDIITENVIVDPDYLTPFTKTGFDTVPNVEFTAENNGHTVQVNLNTDDFKISGGGLHGTYVAQQFHFHWGAVDSRGSEHAVNGMFFPMEIHIVFYKDAFSDISRAMNESGGLAVLGAFFEVGRHNLHFQKIIEYYDKIEYKGAKVPFPSFALKELLPTNTDLFYHYLGSLTTPPCYETVTWTLFKEPIEIAEEQLNEFRRLHDEAKESKEAFAFISDDFRHPQCLGSRKVYASHASLKHGTVSETETSSWGELTGTNLLLAFVLGLCNVVLTVRVFLKS